MPVKPSMFDTSFYTFCNLNANLVYNWIVNVYSKILLFASTSNWNHVNDLYMLVWKLVKT